MNHCFPPSFINLSDRQRRDRALAARGPNDDKLLYNPNIWGWLQPIGVSENTMKLFNFSTLHGDHVIELNDSTKDGKNFRKYTLSFYRRNDNKPAVLRNRSKGSTVLVNLHDVQKGESCILEGDDRIRILRGNGTVVFEFIYRDAYAEDNKGEIFERYYLGDLIGRGGYATVFSAVHRLTGMYFAAKKITQLRDSPSYEISCLAKIFHPSVCQLKEVFFHQDNSIYLVMELCRHGNLLDFIKKGGFLDEKVAQDITFQTCSAMEYVHACDVVHRDLKPENILLDSLDPLRIKITDFGLAKSPGLHGLLKSTNGSELYIAPEVFGYRNLSRNYDNRVDIWSVGAVVVAMLTGHTPYRPRYAPDAGNESLEKRVSDRELTLVYLEQKGYHPREDAYQFAKSLLREDPVMRPTFTQALQLPWLLYLTKAVQSIINEGKGNQLVADASEVHGIRRY